MFAIFYLASFIATFFNVALLGAIRAYSEGKNASFKSGFAFALTKIKSVFLWSLLTFFVGNIIEYLFRPLSDRIPFISTIFSSLFVIAWGVATYFVLPVMVFESHTKTKDMIKESAGIMKEKFGKQISAKVYISALYMVVVIALAVIFVISLLSSIFISMMNFYVGATIIAASLAILFIGVIILNFVINMTSAILCFAATEQKCLHSNEIIKTVMKIKPF